MGDGQKNWSLMYQNNEVITLVCCGEDRAEQKKKRNLSIYGSVYIKTLTYGHDGLDRQVMTKDRTQADMRLLHSVGGLVLEIG